MMLQALITAIDSKPLNPRILDPFLPTCWEKNPFFPFSPRIKYGMEGILSGGPLAQQVEQLTLNQ